MFVAQVSTLTVLALLLIIKITVLVQGGFWTWRHGEEYMSRIEDAGGHAELDRAELGRYLIELGGDRPPMGVYPINYWHTAILPNKPGISSVRKALSALIRTLTALWALVPLTAIVLIMAAVDVGGPRPALVTWMGYTCSVLVVTMMLVSATVTFIGGVAFGSLLPLQSGLPGTHRTPAQVAHGRMGSFMGSAALSWVSAAAAVGFVSSAIGSVGDLAPTTDLQLVESISRFGASIYFVALAMLGVTTVGATTAATKLLMLAVLLLGVALIVFLLGMLVGAVGDVASHSGSKPIAATSDDDGDCRGDGLSDPTSTSSPAYRQGQNNVGATGQVTSKKPKPAQLYGVSALAAATALLAAVAVNRWARRRQR